MPDLVTENAGELSLGLQSSEKRVRGEDLAARKREGVDRLRISQEMKIELPHGFSRLAPFDDAVSDLVDQRLSPGVGVQAAVLLNHLGCGV